MTDLMTKQPVRITGWPGKPTSGRSVYKGRETGAWVWQCDLHDEDPVPDDQWGTAATMVEAALAAIEHARVCPFKAVPA